MPQPPRREMVDVFVDATDALDRLIADMRLGRPSQSRRDDHADEGRRIARLIDAATRPVQHRNPPIGRVGDAFVW